MHTTPPYTPEEEAHELEALMAALEASGDLFPTTEATVSAYEQHHKETSSAYADSLPDPMEIIRRGKLPYATVKEESKVYATDNKHSMAARNGSNIPEQILKKMDQLRHDSEETDTTPDE